MNVVNDARGRYHRPYVTSLLQALALDVAYDRGVGDYLYYRDRQGATIEVLDLVGGYGGSLFGHNHPDLVAELRATLDAQRPFHAQASVRTLAGQLAERLSEMVGRTTGRSYVVTLANSGAEAVEAAIKHAALERSRRIQAILDRVERRTNEARLGLRAGTVHVSPRLLTEVVRDLDISRELTADGVLRALNDHNRRALAREPVFLAVEGSFHGKTTGALQLTFDPHFREPWRGVGPESIFISTDPDALEHTIAANTSCFIDVSIDAGGALTVVPSTFVNIAAAFVEPLQGEGGIHELAPVFLQAVSMAASEAGFPLIIDEIQSGLGRTGTFLAAEPSGVIGDYYLLSKSLGGGLTKLGALLVDSSRALADFDYLHSSTFADDDHSSGVALRALDLIDRNEGELLVCCRERGDYLLAQLRALQAKYPDTIAAVRGRGLMIGFELAEQTSSSSPLIRVLAEQHLLGFLVAAYLLHEHAIRVAPALSANLTLRIEPSAYIDPSALERVAHALDCLLRALRDADSYALTRFLGAGHHESLPLRPPAAPQPARTTPIRRLADEPRARVAFLAHLLEPGDLRAWDAGLNPLSDAACARLLDRIRGRLDPFVCEEIDLQTITGEFVRTTIIGLAFTPDQIMAGFRVGDTRWAVELIEKGVELAKQRRCSVVGFGGYTSILTDNCRSIVEPDLTLTSGNSLAAAAAMDALEQATRRLGLGEVRLAVCGAAGNLGAVLAAVAADYVSELVLVGKPNAVRRLERVADMVKSEAWRRSARTPPIRIETDLRALRGCNAIISATNSPQPVIEPCHLGPHPVVICDVAVPRDVDPRILIERPDVQVLRGGVLKPPLGQRLTIPGLPLGDGQVYGCLAETILIGAAGIRTNVSYGPLAAERVRWIHGLAKEHGWLIQEQLQQ